MIKLLILGSGGMLGHKLLNWFVDNTDFDTQGTIRDTDSLTEKFFEKYNKNLIKNIDAFDFLNLEKVILSQKPDVIINAVGIIKQKKSDYSKMIYLNSLLPHKIAEFCEEKNIRFITIGTDCVFSGNLPENESYTEDSLSDCADLYGKSKFLGEVIDKKNTLTLRTSIIGHELKSDFSLLNWFLLQKKKKKTKPLVSQRRFFPVSQQ